MEARSDAGLAPHVVVGIGAARIGIAAGCVLRALAAPDSLAPLPRRHGALLGMLAVDEQPVPVIDIACWVALAGANGADGTASAATMARRIIILSAGTRMAALRVDTLEPLAALPASAIVRLCHDDDPEQLFHSAAILPDSGTTLALLDVGRLFDLAHSWCEASGVQDGSGAAAAVATVAEATHTWALVSAAGQRLALRAEHVAEILAMPEQDRLMGAYGVSLCQWRGSHLAVAPLARLLGTSTEAGTPPLLAVLRLGEHTLGLPIHAVHELRQLAAVPHGVPNHGPERLPCLTISDAHEDSDALHLVDTEALFAMHPEAGLGLALQQAASGDGARRNEETYVVLDADGRLALPIGALEEVLQAAPEDCVPATPGGPAATLNWRGSAIAVHDLRRTPAAAGQRRQAALVVLVVLRGDSTAVALAVDSVVSMVTPGSAEMTSMQRAGETVQLLILGQEHGHSTYRITDAAALLRRSAGSAVND